MSSVTSSDSCQPAAHQPVRASLLLMGAPLRLALAAGVVACVWVLVGWAL